MTQNERDFEIRVQGHTLVRVCDGGIKIDGKDFHSDLKSLSDLVEILSDVIVSAQAAGKPRLVTDEGQGFVAPVPTKMGSTNNLKIVNNI